MRRLNPILLDVLYRVGAYPFDDIQLEPNDSRPANVWVITKTPLPVFIAIHGNGTSVSALVAELHRIQKSLDKHHGIEPSGCWAWWIVAHCENTHSRIISREMRDMNPKEIAVGLNSYAFIPWFDPPDDADSIYEPGAKFSTELLPASELEMDDEGLYTSRDWEDAIEDPDAMDARFAKSLGLDIEEHGDGASFDNDIPVFDEDEDGELGFDGADDGDEGDEGDEGSEEDSEESDIDSDHDPDHDLDHDPESDIVPDSPEDGV